jgi:hypothetical protein
MGFDYGVSEDVLNSSLCGNIKRWPKHGERTALVDADAIAYIVGYTADLQQYLKAKRSNDFNNSTAFLEKKDHANYVLNKWINDADCDSALLYLTDSINNFRLGIAKTKAYKEHRASEKPPFFYEIKQWLMDYHGAILSDGCEADDEISIEAWRRHLAFDGELWTPEHKKFSNFVIISMDKDLKIIPAWHHPPDKEMEWIEPLGYLEPIWKIKKVTAYSYWPLFKEKLVDINKCQAVTYYQGEIVLKSKKELECPKDKWELDHVWFYNEEKQDVYTRGPNKGRGKFKRVKTGMKDSEYIDKLRGGGLKFFYSQILTGDPTDGYPGLEGFGKVKTYHLLDDAKNEEELYKRVLYQYQQKYKQRAISMLIEQAELAWMQTMKGELWLPPKENKGSFPK